MLNSNYFEKIMFTENSLYFRAWTTLLAHIENEETGPEMSTSTYKHSINIERLSKTE